MIPRPARLDFGDQGFPRVSGDDPAPCASAVCSMMFSPRERG